MYFYNHTFNTLGTGIEWTSKKPKIKFEDPEVITLRDFNHQLSLALPENGKIEK